MELDRPSKLQSLLESLTDDQLATLVRKVGGSRGASGRSDIERNLVENFSERLVTSMIRTFFPHAEQRRVYVDSLIAHAMQGYNGELFTKFGITNKGQLRSWLIRNHPDRGGDNDLYAAFLTEMKISQTAGYV